MSGVTEKEKMLSGQPYQCMDKELTVERARCREFTKRYNESDPSDFRLRASILKELLGNYHKTALIEAPFRCDYGYNISIGKRFFANFDCVFLDVNPIKIGDHVLLGPGVHIYTVNHPLEAGRRKTFEEHGREVVIGDNVWIGGKAIICPGVTIGENSVIGAGSVVVKDIPANVLAVGNPCRVVKGI